MDAYIQTNNLSVVDRVKRNIESELLDRFPAGKKKICPLEVKSFGYKTHASLGAFRNKFSSRILNRYLIYTKDTRKDKDTICLSIYMVSFL